MAGTSVQRAMAGAGLTAGAFYAYFADKEELLACALQQAMDDVKRLFDPEQLVGAMRGAGRSGPAATLRRPTRTSPA